MDTCTARGFIIRWLVVGPETLGRVTLDPGRLPLVDQDTDGFVIPSLGIGDSDQKESDSPAEEDSNISIKAKADKYIYLGPHGAPPPRTKQQEQNSSSRKQRLKQKLKKADRRFGGTGREDKVDNLRELVGGKMSINPSKSYPRDWLDPHCHESQFERRRL